MHRSLPHPPALPSFKSQGIPPPPPSREQPVPRRSSMACPSDVLPPPPRIPDIAFTPFHRQQRSTSCSTAAATSPTHAAGSRSPQFYKTRMCPWFFKQCCDLGVKCRFAHTVEELRRPPDLSRTSLCPRFIKQGFCTTTNCSYAHNHNELRATDDFYKVSLCYMWQKGRCTLGSSCRHAHGMEDLRSRSLLMQHDMTIGEVSHQLPVSIEQPAYGKSMSFSLHSGIPLSDAVNRNQGLNSTHLDSLSPMSAQAPKYASHQNFASLRAGNSPEFTDRFTPNFTFSAELPVQESLITQLDVTPSTPMPKFCSTASLASDGTPTNNTANNNSNYAALLLLSAANALMSSANGAPEVLSSTAVETDTAGLLHDLLALHLTPADDVPTNCSDEYHTSALPNLPDSAPPSTLIAGKIESTITEDCSPRLCSKDNRSLPLSSSAASSFFPAFLSASLPFAENDQQTVEGNLHYLFRSHDSASE